MSERGGWAPYLHLFPTMSDPEIAQISGKTLDAVRLKRQRIDNVNGFIGLEIGFFDLETTNLTAIMGRLLVGSFCDSWGRITTYRIDQTNQSSPIDDRELAILIRDKIESYDILCGWNSKLFDVPFLNARLMRWDERPVRKDLKHIDLMYFARPPFARIGSSKLVNVQKFQRLDDEKSDVDWDVWALAGMGDKDALEYVVEHCERDILVLRGAFGKLKTHVMNIHR